MNSQKIATNFIFIHQLDEREGKGVPELMAEDRGEGEEQEPSGVEEHELPWPEGCFPAKKMAGGGGIRVELERGEREQMRNSPKNCSPRALIHPEPRGGTTARSSGSTGPRYGAGARAVPRCAVFCENTRSGSTARGPGSTGAWGKNS